MSETKQLQTAPGSTAELARLSAQIAQLEASIEGLRREALVNKRRLEEALRRQPEVPQHDPAASAALEVMRSRAYRLCLAYYSLYRSPSIGRMLHVLRRGARRARRALR